MFGVRMEGVLLHWPVPQAQRLGRANSYESQHGLATSTFGFLHNPA